MRYRIEKKFEDYFVIGLKIGIDTDCFLYYKDENNDYQTNINSPETMMKALYDLKYIHGNVKDGDIFETDFGIFTIIGSEINWSAT